MQNISEETAKTLLTSKDKFKNKCICIKRYDDLPFEINEVYDFEYVSSEYDREKSEVIRGYYGVLTETIINGETIKEDKLKRKICFFKEDGFEKYFNINSADVKLALGYKEYLREPKANFQNETLIYKNHWVAITGRSMLGPHPHRHYTFIEFVFWCGRNQDLFNYFCNAK